MDNDEARKFVAIAVADTLAAIDTYGLIHESTRDDWREEGEAVARLFTLDHVADAHPVMRLNMPAGVYLWDSELEGLGIGQEKG